VSIRSQTLVVSSSMLDAKIWKGSKLSLAKHLADRRISGLQQSLIWYNSVPC
jgi:hypothetical protein